jgi:4-aminobutyrate--pyruvate transaminase
MTAARRLAGTPEGAVPANDSNDARTDRVMHEALVQLDRAHLVHPVAPWRQHERRGATVLRAGRGVWLTDDLGHELLDAFAGLWCVNVGYG